MTIQTVTAHPKIHSAWIAAPVVLPIGMGWKAAARPVAA